MRWIKPRRPHEPRHPAAASFQKTVASLGRTRAEKSAIVRRGAQAIEIATTKNVGDRAPLLLSTAAAKLRASPSLRRFLYLNDRVRNKMPRRGSGVRLHAAGINASPRL